MTKETGKLLKEANAEVETCTKPFDSTAESGPETLAAKERTFGNVQRGVVRYHLKCATYSIQFWDFPLYQPIRVPATDPNMSFGGVRDSGYWRENGGFGI